MIMLKQVTDLKMQRNSTQNKLIYDPEDCIKMIVNLKKI